MKALLSILFISMSTLLFAQEFNLPALPYSYSSYEPYIDAQTMEIHHGKHHQAYVTNLNKALAGTKLASFSMNQLLMDASFRSDAIRNNAGGHYNHSLFWEILAPKDKLTSVQASFEAAGTSAEPRKYGSGIFLRNDCDSDKPGDALVSPGTNFGK